MLRLSCPDTRARRVPLRSIVCRGIARGVAVFDHPLCCRQDQGTLAERAQSYPLEFPFDRIASGCHPTKVHVGGCRGGLCVLSAGPGGTVRAQRAHGGGKQPGFGGDMPAIPQGVQPAVHPVVGAVAGHVGDGGQDGPHVGGDE